MKRVFSLLFFLYLGLGIFSSQILGSRVEKEKMEVGEVNTYRIFVSGTNGKKIIIPPAKQWLPFHFEVVSDSLINENNATERVVTFTILDEGTFTLPPISVITGDREQKTLSYEISVMNPATGQEKMEDNVLPKDVKLSWNDYWQMYKWYVLAGLLLIALIFLIIFFIKYFKRQKSSPKRESNAALRELSALKKKKYIENKEYRAFYVELIDIARAYMAKRYHLPAEILLTDDLIEYIKSRQVFPLERTGALSQLLLRGDAVKFAKQQTTQEEMELDFLTVEKMIKAGGQSAEEEHYRTEV